jgi:inorganic pyrophosphatase
VNQVALRHIVVSTVLASGLAAAQPRSLAPNELPASATKQLAESLEAAGAHTRHVWRDTPPKNADGTVNAFIEISRGDRQKWELDMAANARAIDRMIPESVGGYPVNYGFVTQTVSYDGDPFDALVLGPPITGGETVRGIVVGLMYMEDEKGPDSKVVLSIPMPNGKPSHGLTPTEQHRIGEYFGRYKKHEPGAFSRVPGWGSITEGMSLVAKSHAFFQKCRKRSGEPCSLDQ